MSVLVSRVKRTIRIVRLLPFIGQIDSSRINNQVAVEVDVARSLPRQQETKGVAALRKLLFEPLAEDCLHIVRVFGQNYQRETAIPAVWPLVLRDFRPRGGLPILPQRDHPELARNFFATADDVADFRREVFNVLTALEQLVVFGICEQLALGVFLLLKNKPISGRVDIEAILAD